MNQLTQTAHSRTRPAWPMAAGSLLIVCFAFATGVEAQQHRAAQLTTTQPSIAAALPATPAAQAQSQVQPVATASTLEQIGAGDMVRVSVFRNPDLTTETRVSEKGTILFPLVGEISVQGLTPAQAGARIAEKLKTGKFVVNPEVTLSMMQVNSRQVSVLGNVNKPGRYPLEGTSAKLTDLLAIAGGISPTGSDQVTIVSTRDGKTTSHDIDVPSMMRGGDLSRNVSLEPGDTVFVHRAPMVYVYGEVQKGGAYRLEKDMTVMQAIAMSGGITPRGTDRGIKVTRKNGDGKAKDLSVRLTDTVQTDDVIYVRESLF
jgi:polysaccharide export outer membrane protein